MKGFSTEQEFREWQAAIARQYGIETAPWQKNVRTKLYPVRNGQDEIRPGGERMLQMALNSAVLEKLSC